ncbi:MAG: hypothetical protein PHS73_03420 [Candidatus Peribacteraceae bacterium]|nr:hypothetical protein [Candidatus Peribacteraceae bacterium]
MKQKLVIIALLLMAGLPVLVLPSEGRAAESASFLLYDEVPNYVQRGPHASENFQLDEDGITWIALPVASTNFQIVSGPPPASASSSSASSVSVSSAASEASSPQGGGRRERGEETHPSAPPAPESMSSSSSAQSMPSSAPFQPSPRQEDLLPQAPSLPPRTDAGTAAGPSPQEFDYIVERGMRGPLPLDAYFFYGDNCQLSTSPVRNAVSPAQEVVCVYRLYLIKLPDVSLLRTWRGVEIILHLADILLVILGVLLICIALVLKRRRSDRQHQCKKRPRHSRRKK